MHPTSSIALVLLLAAPAAAQEQPVLTVYTYDSFAADWGPGPKVEAAFEATCACDLKWVAVEDGVALLTRLKLEGARTDADVVLGLDTNLVVDAKATGLFAPAEIDQSTVDVPGGFEDDVFVPYDYAYFAVVYDGETLPDPPRSLKALVDGGGEGQIVIQDPRTSTPGLGLLLWIKAVYGDDAPDAWAKLKDRVLTVTPGWSESYGLFTKGEASMVLSYTTSPAYHAIEEGTERYRALSFPEGHYLQIEVAGMIENSDRPKLARDFLAFMVGPAFQDIIPTTNWMLPAAKTSTPLPGAFEALVEPTRTLLFSPEEVAEHREAWVDEWLTAMSR